MKALPQNVREEMGNKGVLEVGKSLQKSMKRRAPMGRTGWLKKSIMLEKDGKIVKVMVHAHYAMAVERGRKSRFFIPRGYLEQHSRHPEAGPGIYVENARRWVNLANTRAAVPRPFIKPSLVKIRSRIPKIMLRALDKAIKKSRR